MSLFRKPFSRWSRRDLIKGLSALGVISSGSILSSSIAGLSENKPGTVLKGRGTWKGDRGYEVLRKTLNWQINTPARYPGLIVRADSEEQVINAIQFAAENNLQISSRSSGHNSAGAALRNGGMLLDVAGLSEFSIDVSDKIALLQPGVRTISFYQALAEKI